MKNGTGLRLSMDDKLLFKTGSYEIDATSQYGAAQLGALLEKKHRMSLSQLRAYRRRSLQGSTRAADT
jgi:hypothetical protein